jgi:hypothetical protein
MIVTSARAKTGCLGALANAQLQSLLSSSYPMAASHSSGLHHDWVGWTHSASASAYTPPRAYSTAYRHMSAFITGSSNAAYTP